MQVKKDFFVERSDKGQLILTPYALCAPNSDKRGLSNIDDLRTIFTCQNGTVLEKQKKKILLSHAVWLITQDVLYYYGISNFLSELPLLIILWLAPYRHIIFVRQISYQVHCNTVFETARPNSFVQALDGR